MIDTAINNPLDLARVGNRAMKFMILGDANQARAQNQNENIGAEAIEQ